MDLETLVNQGVDLSVMWRSLPPDFKTTMTVNDIEVPFWNYKSNAYLVPFTITGKYSKRNIKIVYGKPYKVSDDLEKENKKLENIITKMLKENKR